MSHIWTRRPTIIEPKQELLIPSSLAGFWTLTAIRPDGRKRKLAEFPNLILNSGLDTAPVIGWMNQCRVGTGNTAPAVGQTQLVAQIATSSTQQSLTNTAQGSAPYYGFSVKTYRFAAGVATGNIAEIGIGPTGGGTSLFSRALILDGGGSPTTVTVLSDEVLDATYELRNYPVLGDVAGTLNISGIDYDTLTRPSLVTNQGWAPGNAFGSGAAAGVYGASAFSGAINSDITLAPGGTASNASSTTQEAYTNGTYFKEATSTWNLTTGNVPGGVRSVRIDLGNTGSGTGGFGFYQTEFTPVIPKDATKVLTLKFRHTWARKTI